MNRSQLENQARQAAIRELNARKNAREHLIDFTTYTMPNYVVGAHHRLICEKLEAVERGEIDRLVIDTPPRHGKSELTTKRFPAWFMGRNPTKQIITTSYSADLANDFGRSVRNIIKDRSFKNIFPDVELSPDSQAKDNWHTTKGGVYVAAGMTGGGITGKGAHLAIIDDPIKNREEANSEVIRKKIWDAYTNDLYTRLMPKEGAIIVIQTRWHVDDLIGRLLEHMENETGDHWERVHLPAIALENDVLGRSPGEALWPVAFNVTDLKRIQRAMGEMDFEALYQGSPIVASGSFFKTSMLNIVDAPVKGVQFIRRWDLAATEKKSNKSDPDWTVGLKMQRNDDGGYTVLDVVRIRANPDEVNRCIVGTASQDGRSIPVTGPLDPGSAGVAQSMYFIKMLAGYRVDTVRENGDKVTRAAPFAAQVNAGNVSLVRAPWNKAFIDELTTFPNGKHDDQVDASSGAFEKVGIKLSMPKMPSRAQIIRI